MNARLPTVYIIDDDPDVGRALGRLLRSAGYQPIIFLTAHHFLREYDPAAPGCLILDYRMPELDGLEVQTRLNACGARHPIVFLTGLGTIPLTVDAVRAGALNVLTKPIDETTLLRAVAEAVKVDRDRRLQQERSGELLDRYAMLTAREREVMAHVVRGRLNKQIAADLGTVEKTIKVHRARAMQKMGAASLAELVRLALRVQSEMSARGEMPPDGGRLAPGRESEPATHHRETELCMLTPRSLLGIPGEFRVRTRARSEREHPGDPDPAVSADEQGCDAPDGRS